VIVSDLADGVKQVLSLWKARSNYQVVGWVRNTKYYELREDFCPIAIFPGAQDDTPASITVGPRGRSAGWI